jgi:pilus assembly protein Flp/PilA
MASRNRTVRRLQKTVGIDPHIMEFAMKTYLKKTFARLMKDEEGVTLVEYAIALTLAVGVGVGALSVLSGDVNAKMGEASAELADQTP